MHDLDALNWDDVRLFAVIAESKSLREAAQRLGLTHPTVRRRLDNFEEAVGLRLVDRRQGGHQLTEEGSELLHACMDVQESIQRMLRKAGSVDRELKGPVRVSMATELLIGLAPALVMFQQRWPEIELQLDTKSAFADLGRSEVDVAVRGYRGGGRPDAQLAGRKAVSGRAAVYGDAQATPYWIGSDHSHPRSGWNQIDEFAELPVRSVVPNVLARHAACAAGLGIAMLPCLVGERGLPRLTPPIPDFDIWVLVHPDLRNNARLRVFRDEMVQALRDMKPQLMGA